MVERLDPVLHALGPLGTFTVVQCVIFYLSYISDAYISFSYIFIGHDVQYRCASPHNQSQVIIPELHGGWLNTSVKYGKCVISVESSRNQNTSNKEYDCVYGMEYDGSKDQSFVSEFDLICDKASLAALTLSLKASGAGIGAFICPWMSDLFGRRRILTICLTLQLVTSFVIAFAPSYVILVVSQFFSGFIVLGVGTTAVTAVVEMIPSSKRAMISGFVSTIWWAVCIASLSPVAYLLRFHSWRSLQFFFCGVIAVTILMTIFLEEPVSWLISRGRWKEAERVLTKAAKWNGKEESHILQIFEALYPQLDRQQMVETTEGSGQLEAEGKELPKGLNVLAPKQQQITDDVEENLGFKDMLTHKKLRINSLVCCLMWFIDALTYSALYLMSESLAFGLYLSFFLNAMVEGASCIIMIVMLKSTGRKQTIGGFHLIAGLSLIASGACFNFQEDYRLKVTASVFSLLGLLGTGGSFNVMYLYTPEIFPTPIRNRALGMQSAAATLGAMIAPFHLSLSEQALWAPGVLCGCGSLLSILLVLLLPESKGRELPQSLADLEAWYDTDTTSL